MDVGRVVGTVNVREASKLRSAAGDTAVNVLPPSVVARREDVCVQTPSVQPPLVMRTSPLVALLKEVREALVPEATATCAIEPSTATTARVDVESAKDVQVLPPSVVV